MTTPSELSFDEILKFMLEHNGRVTNHELVKHFKVFLTNPDMRDEARSTFKKYVNTLAIIKNQNNEKWLILKKKYMSNSESNVSLSSQDVSCDNTETPQVLDSHIPPADISMNEESIEQPPERPPLPLHLNQDLALLNNFIHEQIPPLPQHYDQKENITPHLDEEPPMVFPRRKSSADKPIVNEKKMPAQPVQRLSIPNDETITKAGEQLITSQSVLNLVDLEHKISVKERKQMFNRMASEGDILKPYNNSNTSQGFDEEDRVSVISLDHKSESEPLDSRQKAWIISAARGEYHTLAKMCSENAKLAKTKDPFTTAMHWACKRGDENMVKLIAGVSRHLVNERTNGGYTPLHIAMQSRNENVYRLLVEVYDADPNIRDWSGKKARQYLMPMDTSLSPGSYRKKESFLRIGSLNVRVKKTTEAFSNFLGVGATRYSTYGSKPARLDAGRHSFDDVDQIHKNWGSADNIQKDEKLMPPPAQTAKVRRRGASGRKGSSGSHTRSTPSTPDQPRAHLGANEGGDSDSDSAAGFHAAWRQQRASNAL